MPRELTNTTSPLTMDWWYPKNLPVHRGCSKRWYFIFNGAECADPLPIDGIALAGYVKSQNPHRVRLTEGHSQRRGVRGILGS